ncbi:hypothetical protein [Nonomuraea sp. NPDC050786]|uniref:hypothetical protein n=1 Tax=Nonomuraea sp. NPDC050786 TaxID=3154840 RepID=UPI0034087935
MLKRLAGTALVAATATTLMAAPAGATTTGTTTTAKAQLISTKVYFGRCKDTCQIKVRIRNKSYKTLFNVKLNARLKVNGRKVGSCYDYVGTIRPHKIKWASCVVRTAKLVDAWNDWVDQVDDFDTYANTYVSYRYYR